MGTTVIVSRTMATDIAQIPGKLILIIELRANTDDVLVHNLAVGGRRAYPDWCLWFHQAITACGDAVA